MCCENLDHTHVDFNPADRHHPCRWRFQRSVPVEFLRALVPLHRVDSVVVDLVYAGHRYVSLALDDARRDVEFRGTEATGFCGQYMI